MAEELECRAGCLLEQGCINQSEVYLRLVKLTTEHWGKRFEVMKPAAKISPQAFYF